MNHPTPRTGLAALVVAATLVPTFSPTEARADYRADAELVRQIATQLATGTLKRARQAIAVGPHVGGFGGTTLSPSDGFGGISFGLGIYTFHVRGLFDLQDIVKERLEARVKERVMQMVASGQAAPSDLSEIALQVVEDVKAELLGELRAPPKLPRPKLGLVVEGVRLLSPGGWQARLGASFGVLKVASLGLGLGVQRAGGDTSGLVGAELSVRLTPVGVLRTPVFDLYTRFDYGFGADEDVNTLVFGGRLLLDLL